MLTTSMFIVGGIIFLLYIFGLIFMIRWAHKTQEKDMKADSAENKNDFIK